MPSNSVVDLRGSHLTCLTKPLDGTHMRTLPTRHLGVVLRAEMETKSIKNQIQRLIDWIDGWLVAIFLDISSVGWLIAWLISLLDGWMVDWLVWEVSFFPKRFPF